MAKISEKAVERKLVEGVQWLGGIAYKWISPGHVGVPDRIVLLPHGRLVFVELKADDGGPSVPQRAVTARLARLGFPVRIVYGMPGVNQLLDELCAWQEQATVFAGRAPERITAGALTAPWEGGDT